VIVVEALAPYSLAPAWDDWEPVLTGHDYCYARFDSLNRYYVAAEETGILRALNSAPDDFPDAILFRDVKPALASAGHPDHALATLLAGAAMTRLPLLDLDMMVDLLAAGLPPGSLESTAGTADALAACERLYGSADALRAATELSVPAGTTLRDLYRQIVASDRFRAACGRISASYAW
jgi:LmbE family N-acetylglucosaminyl deacetylase